MGEKRERKPRDQPRAALAGWVTGQLASGGPAEPAGTEVSGY